MLQVEREYWFEWDENVHTQDKYRYVVVHAHSLIKWDKRYNAAHPMALLGQVNVRHCRTHADFPNDGMETDGTKPSNSMQKQTEKRGRCVGQFNSIGGLDWRDPSAVAQAGAEGEMIRDVLLSGEGACNFTKAKDRSFTQKSRVLTEG